MSNLKRENVTTLVAHCSATKAHQDINATTIRDWHIKKRKWSDIGYHYVIKRDGQLELGRSTKKQGAHVKGHNHYTLGICLVGGLDAKEKPENNFSEAQFLTLRNLCKMLKLVFPIKHVVGHRDLLTDNSKACPCFDVKELGL